MEKVFYREDGDDQYVRVQMILVDKRGSLRERLLEMFTKDYGDLRKTFLEFLPALSIDLCFLSYDTADLQGSMVLHYMRGTPSLDFPVVLVVPSQQNLPHIQDHVLGFDDSVIWPQEVHGFVEKMESLAWGRKASAAPAPRQGMAG